MLSRSEVNKAGKLLRSGDVQGAKPIIYEWRKEHSYPLQHLYITESFKKINGKDYITLPRDSGYRGVHHIYSYLSAEYNGILLEVQYRTKLQHLWATAVEMFSECGQHKRKVSLWLLTIKICENIVVRSK